MTKAAYIGIDNTSRQVKTMYVGVDGIARKVKKAYIGVDGVAKEWYSSGKKASEYGVGDIVLLPENGKNVEYVVVHQGLPSSIYDASCNGTWLVRKEIYKEQAWHTSNVNDYKNSSIHSYLNNTFFKSFNTIVQSSIKQVKIPYREGSGTSKTVTSGSNGLSSKAFLLSASEIGLNYNGMPTPYGKLDYFSTSDTKRIAYYGGNASAWWTRSPYTGSDSYSIAILNTGERAHIYCSSALGIRPTVVIDSSTNFNPETNIIEEG